MEIDHDSPSAGGFRKNCGKPRKNLTRVNRVMVMGELTTASIGMRSTNRSRRRPRCPAPVCSGWPRTRPIHEATTSLQQVVRGCHHAGEIIGACMHCYARQPPRKDRLDINEIIREVIAINDASSQRSGVMVSTRLAADLPAIAGDRVQLQQVVLNLIVNAAEAMKGDDPARAT